MRDDDELQVWLGDQSASDPNALATKRDPQCRFMYEPSQHQYSKR